MSWLTEIQKVTYAQTRETFMILFKKILLIVVSSLIIEYQFDVANPLCFLFWQITPVYRQMPPVLIIYY
jgi:hypothetical protein